MLSISVEWHACWISAVYTVDWVNVPEIVELFVRKERLNVSENVSLYHFRGKVERDFSKGKKEEGLLVRWTVFNESMD